MVPKSLAQPIFTFNLNLLLTEEVQIKTIIIPPKNIIIKVYINHIKPIKCMINPNKATKLISLKHIEKGDFAIKRTINLASNNLFINIMLGYKLNP